MIPTKSQKQSANPRLLTPDEVNVLAGLHAKFRRAYENYADYCASLEGRVNSRHAGVLDENLCFIDPILEDDSLEFLELRDALYTGFQKVSECFEGLAESYAESYEPPSSPGFRAEVVWGTV